MVCATQAGPGVVRLPCSWTGKLPNWYGSEFCLRNPMQVSGQSGTAIYARHQNCAPFVVFYRMLQEAKSSILSFCQLPNLSSKRLWFSKACRLCTRGKGWLCPLSDASMLRDARVAASTGRIAALGSREGQLWAVRCASPYGVVIGGGLRRLPDSAFPAIAASKTRPPISVLRLAVSPRKSQTQSGPSRTSANESSASSAAGRLRDPSV
jgi:hypothetical protein